MLLFLLRHAMLLKQTAVNRIGHMCPGVYLSVYLQGFSHIRTTLQNTRSSHGGAEIISLQNWQFIVSLFPQTLFKFQLL